MATRRMLVTRGLPEEMTRRFVLYRHLPDVLTANGIVEICESHVIKVRGFNGRENEPPHTAHLLPLL
jgi:hypothetical protein